MTELRVSGIKCSSSAQDQAAQLGALVEGLTRTATNAILTVRGSPKKTTAESAYASGVITPENEPTTGDVEQQLLVAERTVRRMQRNEAVLKSQLELAKKASLKRKSQLENLKKDMENIKSSLEVMQTWK